MTPKSSGKLPLSVNSVITCPPIRALASNQPGPLDLHGSERREQQPDDRPYGPCPYCLRGLLGADVGRVGPCGVRRVAQGARAELARHVAKGAEELPEPQGGEQQLMHKTFWRKVLFATTQKSSAALRMRCLSTQLEGDPRTTPFGEGW